MMSSTTDGHYVDGPKERPEHAPPHPAYSWHRVATPDGATVAYVPDRPTAERFARVLNRSDATDTPDVPANTLDLRETAIPGRRLGRLSIGGVAHHVEAFEIVEKHGEKTGASWQSSEYLSDLYIAFGLEGPPVTVPIDGREYALFLTPTLD